MREWGKFRMLYVVIGIILVIVLVISYGAWMRKKAYNAIDRAEERRMELVNRPVAHELAQIKKLKMAGDTEKKFEKWRAEWDKIVASELPSIETTLFNCEELTDKYHFKKSARKIAEMHARMDTVTQQIEKILSELKTVVDSESKNRNDVQAIKESYHQVKKIMITKRSLFGQALPLLDQQVKTIDEHYKKYGSETDNGNYIEARKHLIEVKQALELIRDQIGKIPDLYEDIRKKVPEQIKELRHGKEEMEEQGYTLEHLQIEVQLEEMEKHLQIISDSVNRMELTEAGEALKNIHEQLDWLIGQLEKEVLSRQQLKEMAPEVEQKLDHVGLQIKTLTEEVETVKDSYHIDSAEIKNQRDIQKAYDKLEENFFNISDALKNHNEAFSLLLENLKKIHEDMESIASAAAEFDAKIKALRKDELTARDSIRKLKHALFETRRAIVQSNLPGVPTSFEEILEQAGTALVAVNEKLDETPLNMAEVQQTLTAADKAAGSIHEQAEKLIETASFAEEMIRYGNRYRTDSQEINKELNEAEDLFRHFDYSAAAETAVRAIEKKEPKILKRTDLYEVKQQV